jgi:hypothetical protein
METSVRPAQPAQPALDQPLDQVVEDQRTVQFLKVYVPPGAFYLEPGVLISDLDLHSALRAQVRPTVGAEGTLPHLVQRYMLMRQKDGTYPPPGICHQLENGRYELLDARQRVEAARNLGVTRMPMYVITSDDEEVLWDVALRANDELNGQPPSEEDIEHQILAYKEQFPNAANVAIAALFKRTDSYVGQVLSRARTGERLETMGFKTRPQHPDDPEAAIFTPSIIQRLSPIQDTAVLRAAAELVRDARLSNPMTQALVTELKDKFSEADRLAVIEAKREDGLAGRIRKVESGVVDLPPDDHPVRMKLMNAAERLARQLAKYKSPAAAEMTDPRAAQDFWGYIVSIEMSARRLVGPNATTKPTR